MFGDGNLQRSIYKTFDGKNHATHAFKDAVHSLASLVFLEKKGLMTVNISSSPDQVKDMKEVPANVDFAFSWATSQIRVLW